MFKTLSNELFNKARELFNQGKKSEAIQKIEESNSYLIKSFVENDDLNIQRFFGVNKRAEKFVNNIKIPIRGVSNQTEALVKAELEWQTINNCKPHGEIAIYLMFEDFEWEEYDLEMARRGEKAPDKVNVDGLRKLFHELSEPARRTLVSYNVIGRKRNIKKEHLREQLREKEGYLELVKAGYIFEQGEHTQIEFPVGDSIIYIRYEFNRIAELLQHLHSLTYREKELAYISSRERDIEDKVGHLRSRLQISISTVIKV